MTRGPILVIDDDAVSRHVLVEALKSASIPCITASSGTEALERIEAERPSLVLLDLVMPAPDGYQLLRILRARPKTRELPIVVLTALDASDEIARAFEAGADDFLRKPFRPAELIARVRGQQRLRQAMEELETKERDAQVVLELTQALASNLDFRSILFTVVQRIAGVANIDRVSIVLVREDDDIGYVVAASDDEHLRDLPIELDKYPEIREVLASGKPFIVADSSTHELLEILPTEAQPSFTSLAIVPIVFDGRPLGVLFLRSRHAHTFGQRELALCRTVASAMAIALRNARVLQSLRDQTQEVTVARFEAERRMRSLQRYADLFESAADGIVVMDVEGLLLFTNPRARELTGYDDADLRGRKLGDIFAPADAGLAAELRRSFAEGAFPKDVDIRILCKDGHEIIVNVSFSSVLREEAVVLGSFRDVTQDRAVEAELVRTKDFLQRVIDASPDAIISADMDGTVLLFNRAAERIYGFDAKTIVGGDVRRLYPDGTAREIMRLIREAGGRVEGARVDIIDGSGARVPVALSGALILKGASAVGSVGVLTDLREKVLMEQKLHHAQEQLIAQERQSIVAELAGAAAHELNQPLTSIMNYATLLRRLLEAGTSAMSAAEIIEVEAERMAGIVRKIGKMTKYETKSYVGKQKILDLDRSSESEPRPPSREVDR